MKVKELIEALRSCDQEAEVVTYAFEDGAVVKEVLKEHPAELYWKADPPVSSDTPAVAIGDGSL